MWQQACLFCSPMVMPCSPAAPCCWPPHTRFGHRTHLYLPVTASHFNLLCNNSQLLRRLVAREIDQVGWRCHGCLAESEGTRLGFRYGRGCDRDEGCCAWWNHKRAITVSELLSWVIFASDV